jgi:hypothetical protein
MSTQLFDQGVLPKPYTELESEEFINDLKDIDCEGLMKFSGGARLFYTLLRYREQYELSGEFVPYHIRVYVFPEVGLALQGVGSKNTLRAYQRAAMRLLILALKANKHNIDGKFLDEALKVPIDCVSQRA